MPTPSLDDYLQMRVVLDTSGAMLFIGQLVAVSERGYWLAEADVHDRDEAHSTNEQYVNDACLLERSGERHANRRRVFVERAAVVSISALDDVIADGQPPEDPARWNP